MRIDGMGVTTALAVSMGIGADTVAKIADGKAMGAIRRFYVASSLLVGDGYEEMIGANGFFGFD